MATNTYVALDKKTVTTAVASVEFTSISQAYTDLVIVINGAASSGSTNTLKVNYNGDTTSGLYSHTRILGDGSSASSARQSNANYAGAGDTGSDRAVFIINIQNYANSTTNKTHISRSNSENYVSSYVGLWRNTAAITSVALGINTLNWAVGTTFSLYGIAAEGMPYATGGYITSDANYYYHTFKSTGTFTPLQSLSVDCLVIAGGGGGGGSTAGLYGASGGAGGVSYLSGSTVSATTYNVVVGGGGAGSTGTGNSGSNSSWNASVISNGGGGGGTAGSAGANGGSGGGGANYSGTSVGTATQGNTGGATGYGNNGGYGTSGTGNNSTGGAGGSGAAGTNGVQNVSGGNGGSGLDTWSTWATATSTGVSGRYAGGGAGFLQNGSAIGTSNAGAGVPAATNGGAATVNTGSGGGGVFHTAAGNDTGGSGGSGLVIVRYAK